MDTSVESTASQQPVIKAYKGFDKNMQCRGYQYKVGESYEHQGKVKACEGGFHSCEYPLDVFKYYEPASAEFAEVEAAGEISKHGDDTKVSSSKLTVKASIGLPGLISAAIEYTMARIKTNGTTSNSGSDGAASNSGSYGAASNSGSDGIAAAFGYEGKSKSTESGAIVCVYRDDEGKLVHIKASKVGDNGIKADTWYMLDSDGEFVDCRNTEKLEAGL